MALKRAPDLCILPVFFMVCRHLPKQSKVASLGRRLHKLGHPNVTIGKQTRWLTPAGLCVSTQLNQRDRELANFSRGQTSGRAR